MCCFCVYFPLLELTGHYFGNISSDESTTQLHLFVQINRKEDMKEKADQAATDIEFRVDAEMEDTGMEDLETTTSKLLVTHSPNEHHTRLSTVASVVLNLRGASINDHLEQFFL